MTEIGRRALLKRTAASVAFLAAPSIVNATGSQGVLNHLGWGGYAWEPVFDAFTAETGIRINLIGQPNHESILAQAKLVVPNGGADLAEPVHLQLPNFISQGLLDPIDDTRVDYSKYLEGLPGTVDGDSGHYQGKHYFAPILWGGEGMMYAENDKNAAYGVATLEHLLDPAYEGMVNVNASSMLLVLGRILDKQGKLPFPLMNSFSDEAACRAIYDAILPVAIVNKRMIGQFFTAENDAMGGFLANGCTVGFNWESTGRYLYGQGFTYVAPKEGASAWCQGLVLLKNAVNGDEAYEYIKFQQRPEISAQYAEISAINPVIKGAPGLLSHKSKEFYRRAYPDDAVANMWWVPGLESWHNRIAGEAVDKWLSA